MRLEWVVEYPGRYSGVTPLTRG